MDKVDIIKLVHVYIISLSSGDFSLVKFTQNVKFLGPLIDSPVEGISDVFKFLICLSEGVKYVRVL